MKFLRWLNILALLTFISACSPGSVNIPILSSSTATTLPQPPVTIESAPDAGAALTAYLEALKADKYNDMYAMLSKVSQDALSLEEFAKRNRDALNEMSAGSFDYKVMSSLVNAYSSQVSYHVTYHTALVGDIDRDMVAKFSLERKSTRLNSSHEWISRMP